MKSVMIHLILCVIFFTLEAVQRFMNGEDWSRVFSPTVFAFTTLYFLKVVEDNK